MTGTGQFKIPAYLAKKTRQQNVILADAAAFNNSIDSDLSSADMSQSINERWETIPRGRTRRTKKAEWMSNSIFLNSELTPVVESPFAMVSMF